MATRNRTLDILVIGAGQAGLALGYHLKATPFTFQIVDCHRRIGDSWRKRYDSLVLFTPQAYSALPGLIVPGDPEGYATKDDIATYLIPGRGAFEIPSTSKSALQEVGFEIVEERQPSFLLGGTLLVTGEIDQTTEFEHGMPGQ